MSPVAPVAADAAETVDAAGARPPLKWAGGKRWQVKHVLPYWESVRDRRLVEPFAGGLAVALRLRPRRALLNDVNPHLINFYRWLKRGLTIAERFRNNERAYYRARARFNDLLARGEHETAEAAGLFYYLNRTGYNGLCRFNRSGRFNVPFGQYSSISYRYDFSEYQPVFGRWDFTSVSFRELELDPADFVYADPPYDVEFTAYSKERFGWEDQKATATWLAAHRGPVILSNQATKRILDLYRQLDFRTPIYRAPRRISCTGDRSPVAEVLATRNL